MCIIALRWASVFPTDVFESIILDLFQLDGVTNIADDFLVYGRTQEEHDRNVLAFLHRCVEVDMHLNPDKIRLNASEVPFFGNVLTKNGIKPVQSKVKAIKDWPTPTNVKELQSFLGTVNYLSRFIPNLSRLRAQLQALARKDTPFVWTSVHDKAFHSLKCAISNDCLLQFYNPDADLYIEVDSSLSGTGYCMLQEYSEVMENPVQGEREIPQNLRPIAYGSKSFSSAETRYSNIERELLGILCAIQNFKHFFFGRSVKVITDHKLLFAIFKKSFNNTTPRLARLLLQLVEYDLEIIYQKGRDMFISDALSRLSSHNERDGAETEIKEIKVTVCDVELNASPTKLDQIKTETQVDEELQMLVRYINSGWPAKHSECTESVRKYFNFRDELSVVDGLILKGNRIVIPAKLWDNALSQLHQSHLGECKTILHARTCIFWPGINLDIKNLISRCDECQKFQNKQPQDFNKSRVILAPWDTVASDLFEFNGRIYLLLVDHYSKFMVVRWIEDHSTQLMVKMLQIVFSDFGIPRTLVTDRGSNFMSTVFAYFCTNMDIIHKVTSAYHHQLNFAERGVQTIKKLMKKCGENW